MAESLDIDELFAHHEASHAVAAFILGNGVNYCSIGTPEALRDNLKNLGVSSTAEIAADTEILRPQQYDHAAMILAAPEAFTLTQGYSAPEQIYKQDRDMLRHACAIFGVTYTDESWSDARKASLGLLTQTSYAVPAILAVSRELLSKRRLEGQHVAELLEHIKNERKEV